MEKGSVSKPAHHALPNPDWSKSKAKATSTPEPNPQSVRMRLVGWASDHMTLILKDSEYV